MIDPGKPPRVSVVMAIHDGEPYVVEGIGSLLAQTFHDFELIVVDDGSTDRTAELVRSFGDPRIRLVHNERNLGLAPSLNRGLVLARGELVARQDVDDRSLPERLARQVAFMDAHPDVALLGSCYVEIAADGTSRGPRTLATAPEDLAWELWLRCPIVHSAAMWRRVPVAEQVGGYDERLAYSMDYDLWWRVAERFRLANLPEHLVEYRVHERSMTATWTDGSREGFRLRAARAARVLGWPVHDPRANEERFAGMCALLFDHGSPSDRPAHELRAHARELLRLHETFARVGALDAASSRRQRRRLRARLADQLRRAARRAAREGRRAEGWRLLRAVAEVAPAELPFRETVRTGLVVAAAMLRPR